MTFGCTLFFLAMTPGLRADTVLTSSNTNGAGYGINSSSNAEEITLSVTADITTIEVELVGSTALTATSLEILANNSGNPGTLLATDTGVTDAGYNGSTFTLATFTFSSPQLGPGTYWLETINSGYSAWEIQSPYSSTGPDGSFTTNTIQYGNHDTTPGALMGIINGNVVTPEPSTALTAFGAVVALWIVKRRFRFTRDR
jgi:hypothetical protein